MTSWHFAHEQDVYWICDPCNGGSASPALARALDELGVLTPASHPTAPAPGQSPAAAARQPSDPDATVFERLRQEFRAACPNASASQYGQAMKAIREVMN